MTIRRVAASIAVTALVALGWPGVSAADGPPPSLTCVTVSSSAPFDGTGYTHLVHINNGCSRAVTCTVSTDVNPTAQQARVPAGEATDVVTWRGSPARVFVPNVSCVLDR